MLLDLPCSKKQRLDEAGTSKLAGKSTDEESGMLSGLYIIHVNARFILLSILRIDITQLEKTTNC